MLPSVAGGSGVTVVARHDTGEVNRGAGDEGGKRLHIGFQEFTEDLAVRTHTTKNYMKSARLLALECVQDSGVFIIRTRHLNIHICKPVEVIYDSNWSVGSTEDNSEYESTSVGWYEQKDTVEEEDLTLTFSDKVMVRSFSSKAKKVLQKHTASNFHAFGVAVIASTRCNQEIVQFTEE
ncbi:hypothetical protein D0Y65_032945 [Glycine soja]|uniref:Uncharacterized protein n=1 Tax=Glycine soja TaxID=3848 RepID=A0A445HIR9_GLYSO|nr:hypothetical protein D0Y65_032945 [Glycine soja]